VLKFTYEHRERHKIFPGAEPPDPQQGEGREGTGRGGEGQEGRESRGRTKSLPPIILASLRLWAKARASIASTTGSGSMQGSVSGELAELPSTNWQDAMN
jgi:hypothetical protein